MSVLQGCEWNPQDEREMYKGTFIADLLSTVTWAESVARQKLADRQQPYTYNLEERAELGNRNKLEPEQFAQPLGLSAADGNLGLLFVVHSKLVGTFEPGNDFADAVDVDQVGAMGSPEKLRI